VLRRRGRREMLDFFENRKYFEICALCGGLVV